MCVCVWYLAVVESLLSRSFVLPSCSFPGSLARERSLLLGFSWSVPVAFLGCWLS